MLKQLPTALKVDPNLAFVHSEVSEMHRYWHGLKSGSSIPFRQDVDPISAPRPLLPHMALVEVLEDERAEERRRRYRLRLVGTHITTALDRDFTGAIVDEIYSEADESFLSDAFGWVIEQQKPLRLTGTAEFAGKGWLSFEAVYLPLRQPCGAVKTILIGSVYS